jgi:hypothetical protein
MSRYGQAIDRDSAQEMLARKLAAGAEKDAQEKQAATAAAQAEEDAKARAKAQAQAERESRTADRAPGSTSRSRPRPEKSVVAQITGNTAFRQFARTAGREIVRSIFGTARRGR